MQAIETPKANPENLLAIIREAYYAKVVVPEFQRTFVWPREDIEEFMASILQGYFVGTFLLLDAPTRSPMFPFRTVEGLEQVNPLARPDQHTTVRLVLDGQQRITSVFYVLYAPRIPLGNARYPYRFFLRLEEALGGNLDEAVVGVSTRDRRRMAEMEKLVEAQRALPFQLLRESSDFYRWLHREQHVWEEADQRRIETLYQRLERFMVPVVSLSPETGEDNIVNIFERINRTGISLSLFDLAEARLYLKLKEARLPDLRRLWQDFVQAHPGIKEVTKPEFLLKAIALFRGKEPRKGNLLDVLGGLEAEAFYNLWNEAAEAIILAYRRITQHYGASEVDWIPYTTIIVPLAALLHELKIRSAAEEAYRKVDRWYWASILSQRYDSAVDTKTYRDVQDVRRWIDNDSTPEWLERLTPQDIDFDVDEPRSALYRGLLCLIARRGARDFLTGQPALLHECQDDHIFPRALYGGSYPVDTILNRTLISKATNNKKRDKKPSEFLGQCLAGHGQDEARLRETLDSHFISPEAYAALQRNDFDAFVEARRRALSRAVQDLLRGTGP